jgi:hypothetical protein
LRLVRQPTVGSPEQCKHRSGIFVVVFFVDGRPFVDDVSVEKSPVTFAEGHDHRAAADLFLRLVDGGGVRKSEIIIYFILIIKLLENGFPHQ